MADKDKALVGVTDSIVLVIEVGCTGYISDGNLVLVNRLGLI